MDSIVGFNQSSSFKTRSINQFSRMLITCVYTTTTS